MKYEIEIKEKVMQHDITNLVNEWIEDFTMEKSDEFGSTVDKKFIAQILKVLVQETQRLVKEIEKIIIQEILICHQENQPTSRLTSLANQLKKSKVA